MDEKKLAVYLRLKEKADIVTISGLALSEQLEFASLEEELKFSSEHPSGELVNIE